MKLKHISIGILCFTMLFGGNVVHANIEKAPQTPIAMNDNNKIRITFDVGEGHLDPDYIEIEAGERVDLSNYVPTKDGEKFINWFTDNTFTESVDINKVFHESTTIYALFSPIIPSSNISDDIRNFLLDMGLEEPFTEDDMTVVSDLNTEITTIIYDENGEEQTEYSYITDFKGIQYFKNLSNLTIALDTPKAIVEDSLQFLGSLQPLESIVFKSAEMDKKNIGDDFLKYGDYYYRKLSKPENIAKYEKEILAYLNALPVKNKNSDLNIIFDHTAVLLDLSFLEGLSISNQDINGIELSKGEDDRVHYVKPEFVPNNPEEKAYKISFDTPVKFVYFDQNNALFTDTNQKYTSYDSSIQLISNVIIEQTPEEEEEMGKPLLIEYTDLSGNKIQSNSDDFPYDQAYKDMTVYLSQKQYDVLAKEKNYPMELGERSTFMETQYIGDITNDTAPEGGPYPDDNLSYGIKVLFGLDFSEEIDNTYTVTFETNGGSPIGSETVLENTAVTKPADPTRNGYIFAGWYTDSTLQTPFDFATLINQDTTVYAKWEKIPVNYTVTFETNGGSTIGNETVLENTAVTKPADPTRDGYTFAGWYADSTLQTPFDFATLINQDTTVYAKWEKIPVNYTVTFETNGGSPIGSETVLENTAVTKPADPTRDGYTFAGWYEDSTLQTSFDFATLINADTTVYAKWEKIPVNYTVTFETNGGSPIGNETVLENTAVTKPADPTRDGYTFAGWYEDALLQTPFDFATLINQDTTVYAKWEKIPVNYTVTFETNGGSPIGNETVLENTAVTKPVDPTRDGYTFVGWYADSTLQTPFDFATLINADTTVYAKWEKIPVTYTVTFETNGGSAIGNETVLENTAVTKPVDPTLVDHTFEGWFTDATLQTPFDFATLINADTTLYAKWSTAVTPIDTYFTVNYESNGGSAVDSERVLANTKATQPNAPTRVDHTFDGWFTDAALQTPFDFATLINADTTLYAKWSTAMTPIDTYYTVNYESNGGSAVDSERVLANTKATQPNAPTLVDHTFEGWFTDATLQTPFDFATLINADTTLYAKWSTNMTPINPVKPTPIDPKPIIPTPVTPKPDVEEPGEETPEVTLPATGIESNNVTLFASTLAMIGFVLIAVNRKRKIKQ